MVTTATKSNQKHKEVTMWKHNQEAIDAVEQFNEAIDIKIGDHPDYCGDFCMTVETNGYEVGVKFMGVVIWDSENDTREEDDAPLIDLLREKAKSTLDLFARVLEMRVTEPSKSPEDSE